MAGGAVPDFEASAGGVARDALDASMATRERKACCRMVERPGRPPGRRVTARAVSGIGAAVGVVLMMALRAGRRRVLEARAGVAGGAGEADMAANQRKLRRGVIEADAELPPIDAVAGAAVLTQLAGMRVPCGVAAGASHLRLGFVRGTDMALRAGHPAMGAAQGEARGVVVEGNRCPAGHAVTLLAGRAVGAAMLVIRGVTAKAGCGRGRLARRRRAMALAAGQGRVRAGQGEPGAAMVKARDPPIARCVAVRA